jgi:hypothetical protein
MLYACQFNTGINYPAILMNVFYKHQGYLIGFKLEVICEYGCWLDGFHFEEYLL